MILRPRGMGQDGAAGGRCGRAGTGPGAPPFPTSRSSAVWAARGNSTEVSRPIAGGSAQFHPSGLTLSGKWDSRCSGQCQPCIRESTTLLGGGHRGTEDGSWGSPCGAGPSFSGTNHPHWLAIYRSASPEGTDDKGPTPGGMAKSQTPKTPTLTRTMRHIKWRVVTDGHRGPTYRPARLHVCFCCRVRVWILAFGELRARDICTMTD